MNASDETLGTNDLYEEQAMQLVEQLLKQGVVEMEDDTPLLTHVPTGWEFESATNLAHFHKGWEVGETSE